MGQPALADAWSEFEQRCLVPFEHQSFADIAGLEPVEAAINLKRYEISDPNGTPLVLELQDGPEDGLRSCSVSETSKRSVVMFEAWIAESIAEERYVEVEEDRWHSVLWIEPVLEIQLHRDGEYIELRIVETELET